jgi:glycosyltransferase involved in cell wall biosynthesis
MIVNLSVIVPAYNASNDIPGLLNSLRQQTIKDFELIVVDDGSSDDTAEIVRSCECTLIQLPQNQGPACCRNIGARRSQGEVLVFTDSDCLVAPDWLERIEWNLARSQAEAVMGKLELLPSNLLGNSISALGFPAGGSIGFDKIWPVDRDGSTTSLSTCNCAVRREAFWKVGGFDETFPYAGGEDSFLAYNLIKANYKIRYCPDVVVCHPARSKLIDFFRWHFKRGVSSYLFSRKVANKGSFISLRIWSTKNIIKQYCRDPKFPLIIGLLLASFTAQFIGYSQGKRKRKSYESFDY